jgi:hypothetical protein
MPFFSLSSLEVPGSTKMQFTSFFASVLPPIHLFTYSTLLGTELYQSFVMTKVAYQALPRSAFTTLQKRVFPIYFRSQSLLLLIVAATFPPHGPGSMIKGKGDWILFAAASVTAGLNLVMYGPRTQELMIKRVHQGTIVMLDDDKFSC